jgi:hypothetical protein
MPLRWAIPKGAPHAHLDPSAVCGVASGQMTLPRGSTPKKGTPMIVGCPL